MIIIPIKWLFHWEYTLFSDKPIYSYKCVVNPMPQTIPSLRLRGNGVLWLRLRPFAGQLQGLYKHQEIGSILKNMWCFCVLMQPSVKYD
jgi:hypothetical protein